MDLPNINFNLIGQKIRKARKAKGLTQVDISALTGVMQSVICNIEAGKIHNPSIMTVLKIASAVDIVSLDSLLFTRSTRNGDEEILAIIKSLPDNDRDYIVKFIRSLKSKEKE